jgi:hypothetical protein
MEFTNSTNDQIVVVGCNLDYGYGPDIAIPKGETRDINVPLSEVAALWSFDLVIAGKVVCHEGQSGEGVFQVLPGKPVLVSTAINQRAVFYVRHHSDPVDSNVVNWRKNALKA